MQVWSVSYIANHFQKLKKKLALFCTWHDWKTPNTCNFCFLAFLLKKLFFWLTQGSQTLTYVSNINWLSGKYKFWSLSTESQKSNIAMVKVLIDHGFFRALGLQYAKISCYHTDFAIFFKHTPLIEGWTLCWKLDLFVWFGKKNHILTTFF